MQHGLLAYVNCFRLCMSSDVAVEGWLCLGSEVFVEGWSTLLCAWNLLALGPMVPGTHPASSQLFLSVIWGQLWGDLVSSEQIFVLVSGEKNVTWFLECFFFKCHSSHWCPHLTPCSFFKGGIYACRRFFHLDGEHREEGTPRVIKLNWVNEKWFWNSLRSGYLKQINLIQTPQGSENKRIVYYVYTAYFICKFPRRFCGGLCW